MNNIVDLRTLGKRYTILDRNGNLIQTVHLVPESEILLSANGEYDFDGSETPEEFITESVKHLKGFTKYQENISWYAPVDSRNIDLEEIAKIAIRDKNTIIIIQT